MAEDEYVDAEAVAYAVTTAACIIDRQLQVHQNVTERAHGVTRLGIAQLGGITVISGYVLARSLLDVGAGLGILLSATIGIVGTFFALRSAVGSFARRTLSIGPDLDSLRSSIAEGNELTEVHVALISIYQEITIENNETIRRASLLLVASNYFVGVSAVIFFTALVYILWSGIQ